MRLYKGKNLVAEITPSLTQLKMVVFGVESFQCADFRPARWRGELKVFRVQFSCWDDEALGEGRSGKFSLCSFHAGTMKRWGREGVESFQCSVFRPV